MVRHDNVVAIHAVEEADGLPYLVMEYVPGVRSSSGSTGTGRSMSGHPPDRHAGRRRSGRAHARFGASRRQAREHPAGQGSERPS